jgi:hypothetical protein
LRLTMPSFPGLKPRDVDYYLPFDSGTATATLPGCHTWRVTRSIGQEARPKNFGQCLRG